LRSVVLSTVKRSRLALASIVTVPAHSCVAPVRSVVTAARRGMPAVCGVFESRSAARTIRTPSFRRLEFELFMR
jgi:hypothetical protein